MGQVALAEMLKEINMSAFDAKLYDQFSAGVSKVLINRLWLFLFS